MPSLLATAAAAAGRLRPRNQQAGDPPVPFVGRSSTGIARMLTATSQASPEAQMRAMGAVGTLFAIVNRTSTAVASVRWHLWRTAASGKPEDRVEVTRHAALDVLNRPNPWMTRQELDEVTQQHVDLTGEGIWVLSKTSPGGPPLEVWPVRPDRIAPVPDRDKFLAGWQYMSPDGEVVPLRVDEVIQIRMPNPLDPYRGMGPVQAILVDLDAERYTAEWNRAFFVNSAEPGGVVEVEKRLSDDEFEEMVTRWQEQHRGVANAHRVAIIEQGHWVDRKYTQRDMQFAELREVSKATIREAFGIPKFAVGDLQDVNRATADAAAAWFGSHVTVPRLERFKQARNVDLLPMFGATAAGLEFDYESPVERDQDAENAALTARTGAARVLVEAGYERTAVLAAVGLPDIAVGGGRSEGGAAGDATPRELAEIVQKIYLGVDTVLTWEEAREILAAAGARLDLNAPPPAGMSGGPAAVAARAVRLDQPHRRQLPRPVNAEPDLDPAELPDVAPLQEQWETALAALLAALGPIRADQKADLVRQVRKLAESGRLSDLATVQVDTAAAADAVAAAMVEVADLAAGRVVAEADEQGVTVKPRTPDAAEFAEVATVAAAAMGRLLALSAVAAAMRANGPAASAAQVADAVEQALDVLTDAVPADWCGGALTGAQNAARVETLRRAPAGAIYAVETNDKNTCQPCKSVNGTWLGNTDDMDQVLASYPGGAYGGYVGCLGRERCRGTIAGVWR